jgi:hypothetical protein
MSFDPARLRRQDRWTDRYQNQGIGRALDRSSIPRRPIKGMHYYSVFKDRALWRQTEMLSLDYFPVNRLDRPSRIFFFRLRARLAGFSLSRAVTKERPRTRYAGTHERSSHGLCRNRSARSSGIIQKLIAATKKFVEASNFRAA